MPQNEGSAAWVCVATLGGGLVNGDRLSIAVDIAPGSAAVLLSQGSTKVYRSPAGTCQNIEATVGDGAMLVAMPDRVTCFAGARYVQRQRFDLAGTASLVLIDSLSAGRMAMGERWEFERYAASVSITRSGRPILFDRVELDRRDGPIAARMRRFDAIASVVLTGPGTGDAIDALDRRVAARQPGRRSDTVMAVSPLDDGGRLIRLASREIPVLIEELAGIVRPAVAPLGDDPIHYRW